MSTRKSRSEKDCEIKTTPCVTGTGTIATERRPRPLGVPRPQKKPRRPPVPSPVQFLGMSVSLLSMQLLALCFWVQVRDSGHPWRSCIKWNEWTSAYYFTRTISGWSPAFAHAHYLKTNSKMAFVFQLLRNVKTRFENRLSRRALGAHSRAHLNQVTWQKWCEIKITMTSWSFLWPRGQNGLRRPVGYIS